MAEKYNWKIETDAENVELLLFHPGEAEPFERIAFEEEYRIGNVWTMELDGYDCSNLEYGFEADGVWLADPCARAVVGREVWGQKSLYFPRARMMQSVFDWKQDKKPEISYADSVIYRLHVRGFTMHESSGVVHKGSFLGLTEKISYLKDLGVTTVELMPVTDFDEQMWENGKLNYWGYGPSFLYAPKSSYGSGTMPVETEFKTMVQALHKAGMECVMEIHFTGQEAPGTVLDVLRYWIQEYHVDGFKLSGAVSKALIAADPYLKHTKLFADNWDGVSLAGRQGKHPSASLRAKNLAVYNEEFQNDMRKVLKGDQEMLQSQIERIARNPKEYAVINYMANTSGFTMMDMVSYDGKHNEANGEENHDGTDNNFSWNCGEEGFTENKRVLCLRKQQIYNAFAFLLFSQGTPLLLAGDEFGNSQGGNNNAYCQDNEITWLNWDQLEENQDIYRFVKELIAFRRMHKVFHKDEQAKNADYRSLGSPDVSYHGQSAWKADFEYFRKQIGILYWGAYEKKEDGTADDTFYVAYNMHWGTHFLGLPKLPKGKVWRVLYDTSGENGRVGAAIVKDKIRLQIPPRSIVILSIWGETGYDVIDTPIGEITIACRDGKVTELRFGRVVPEFAGNVGESEPLNAERLELLEQTKKQLKEYFAGKRKTFDLPLEAEGTEFQKRVWTALRTIPYGETRSYKDIAIQIGDENACRAVGMANNKNPLAILVPCHRVVGSDGTMVGYAGGLDIKETLLALEGRYRRVVPSHYA